MLKKNHKAILVKVANEQNEKVCATPEQAIEFLKTRLTVNTHSERHINTAYQNIYSEIKNENGDIGYTFSAGNNSKNPSVYVRDITGVSSIAELSPTNLQALCDKMTLHYKERFKDFEINYNGSYIEGGFLWYWVQNQQRHFAIYEIWLKPSQLNSLEEVEKFITKRMVLLINTYLQNNKKQL